MSFMAKNAQESPDYGRIINERHYDRLTSLMESGNVVHGGESDRADLYIAPTLIDGVTFEDGIMQEEIFGPLFPIITVKNIDEAIGIVNKFEKPLALYTFSTNNSVVEKIMNSTSFRWWLCE